MRLPQFVPTSYRCAVWSLTWQLECKAEIRWAQDLALRVPMEVVPWKGRAAVKTERRAPPTVGSERVRAIWERVAQARGLEFDGARMSGSWGGCEVLVEREHRGRQGLYLRGRLRYPSLHLELDIEPVRSSIFGNREGIPLCGQRWDRKHRVSCRDEAQLQGIATHLRAGLVGLERARMTDTTCATEVRNAGVNRRKLDRFVVAMMLMAQAIDTAREHIPPPALMTDALSSWTALAEYMTGSLETARMAIRGTATGLDTRITTEWSPTGEPVCTDMEMMSPMTIDTDRRGRYSGPESKPEASSSTLASPVEADLSTVFRKSMDDSPQLRRLLADAHHVVIDADSVALTLPAPILDGHALRERVQTMATWIRSLCGVAGPYR